MEYMNKIDHLALNGQTLTTFLTVLEETSVSRAADRLGVSQSAVSHTLDKLRRIFGDPLFVRVGRGIEPTARAIALCAPAESVLDGMKSLTGMSVAAHSESMDAELVLMDAQHAVTSKAGRRWRPGWSMGPVFSVEDPDALVLGRTGRHASLAVKDAMTENPVTVTAKTSLVDAARLMLEHSVGSLPVLDNGRLVGILTEGDFVRFAIPN